MPKNNDPRDVFREECLNAYYNRDDAGMMESARKLVQYIWDTHGSIDVWNSERTPTSIRGGKIDFDDMDIVALGTVRDMLRACNSDLHCDMYTRFEDMIDTSGKLGAFQFDRDYAALAMRETLGEEFGRADGQWHKMKQDAAEHYPARFRADKFDKAPFPGGLERMVDVLAADMAGMRAVQNDRSDDSRDWYSLSDYQKDSLRQTVRRSVKAVLASGYQLDLSGVRYDDNGFGPVTLQTKNVRVTWDGGLDRDWGTSTRMVDVEAYGNVRDQQDVISAAAASAMEVVHDSWAAYRQSRGYRYYNEGYNYDYNKRDRCLVPFALLDPGTAHKDFEVTEHCFSTMAAMGVKFIPPQKEKQQSKAMGKLMRMIDGDTRDDYRSLDFCGTPDDEYE